MAPPSPRLLSKTLSDVVDEPSSGTTPSSQTSEEDYDHVWPPASLRRRKKESPPAESTGREALHIADEDGRKYVVVADDAELRDVARRGVVRARDPASKGRKRARFGDLVFTHKFSAFDRQNADAANSPFHGFFTLFWMAVFLFVVRMGANNWKKHGNPLGSNEITNIMFKRDVVLLLLSDGIMCGLTGVSWILQRLIHAGYIDWDRSGWVLQSLWQVVFIAGAIGLTLLREWPWTHTVYFVLHSIVMLMKQHSYAFYNGYLSTVWKRRCHLARKLEQLDAIAPVPKPSQSDPPTSSLATAHLSLTPSAHSMRDRRRASTSGDPAGDADDLDAIAAAIDSGAPLDEDQVRVFERMIRWELDASTDELRGGRPASAGHAYPDNLSAANHYEYVVLPTVVYELEYPRSGAVDWYYVAEKLAACFGILFVMVMVSQTLLYPVVMRAVALKEAGLPLAARFAEFPWLLSDLLFPFMMEYLLSWYLIWETILNLLAELSRFADRDFYGAWWNSVSWDQFARDWNRPVHNFLLRHVYHSSISAFQVDRHTATLITFFLSACIHELVMWCIFKKLRGYLLILQMCQLPLVRLSRTRWLRHKATLGNAIFWLGIFTGPSVLCSLYLIL